VQNEADPNTLSGYVCTYMARRRRRALAAAARGAAMVLAALLIIRSYECNFLYESVCICIYISMSY